MTILDSYAVLALLKDEPAATRVRRLVSGRRAAILTPLGAAEVVDHLVRIVGASDEDAALDLAQLGLADPAPLDAATAIRAGLLRSRHHDRNHRAMSLADCVAAEAARSADEALATADPHLLDLCREEGIEVIALPDSSGRVWTPR